jgi:hypothetical protein
MVDIFVRLVRIVRLFAWRFVAGTALTGGLNFHNRGHTARAAALVVIRAVSYLFGSEELCVIFVNLGLAGSTARRAWLFLFAVFHRWRFFNRLNRLKP